MIKECFWTVGNRRLGVVRAFRPSEKGHTAARRFQKRRPGTWVRFMCIPPRED